MRPPYKIRWISRLRSRVPLRNSNARKRASYYGYSRVLIHVSRRAQKLVKEDESWLNRWWISPTWRADQRISNVYTFRFSSTRPGLPVHRRFHSLEHFLKFVSYGFMFFRQSRFIRLLFVNPEKRWFSIICPVMGRIALNGCGPCASV